MTTILGFLSSLQGTTLVVFTVGNDDDSLTDTLLLRKAVRGHRDSLCNICTLCSHHRRIDARQEHLGRHIVTGDRQLDKGVARKDNQTNLIIGEVIDEVLHHHLGTVQTTGCHIFSEHGVTDIHRYDGLYAGTLLVTNLRTKLWTGSHHNKECQCSHQDAILYQRTEARHVRHQFLHQFGITKAAQAFLLLAYHQPAYHCQHWYDG